MSQGNAAPCALRQAALVTARSAARSQEMRRKRRDIPRVTWANAQQVAERMGWLMGLEPTTTGITIRDSTN